MKVNAWSGFFSTLVGILVSVFGAIIQFLLIFWLLKYFGTEFNGFIRISFTLSLMAGSIEGAMGISTVILLIQPIATGDWITANEIFSTARKKHLKSIKISMTIVLLTSIIYPLEVVLAQNSWSLGEMSNWTSGMILPNGSTVEFWKLFLIIFMLGFKECITANFFGVYENVMQADQKNGLRKILILTSDLIVYSAFFVIIMGQENIDPLLPFLVMLTYPFIRGSLIMLYARKKYTWIKYYSDFNSYKLTNLSKRHFYSSVGQNILMNADIIIILLVLGRFGLKISSMLSLYMVVGLNIRLIVTNFIVSFREYFVSIVYKEGRMQWEAYSKYEFYVYIICALTFVMTSVLSPYIVSGIYGNVIKDEDLHVIDNLSSTKNAYSNSLIKAKDFIFSNHAFSIMFSLSTVGVILYQSQSTLLQAKKRSNILAKFNNIAILGYFFVTFISTLLIGREDKSEYMICNVLIAFYCIKITVLFLMYLNMWIYSWKYLVYNSKLKNIFGNISTLLIPIITSMLLTLFMVDNIYPLSFKDDVAVITDQGPISISIVATLILSTFIFGFISTLIIPLIIRPKVAIAIIGSLPLIRQIVNTIKETKKATRQDNESSKIDLFAGQEWNIELMLGEINSKKVYDEQDFNIEFNSKPKPKIYKIKGIKVK